MTAPPLWEVFSPAGTLGYVLGGDELAAVAAFEGATGAAEILARPARDDEAEHWKAHEMEPAPPAIARGYALIPPDPRRPTWVSSEFEGFWLVHGPQNEPIGVWLGDGEEEDEGDEE